ncbi:alpha-aminoadipic semialdehyde synthase, mitochondrial [Plakobranchus ocellatus]|uniref:Alpha-aminoadipic semialdehyde synthase, mitochondrial n=1 Tax=Plakobranchus ocellatus TaxID=259542 RepID=A0AAV4E192_9GAST|nr:alpha-aminoadipic semialdehyde synthase, mitochondrial [Plakobranchus ocellatus]
MTKKALVLGTGLVSRPCVESLVQTGFMLTCVSAIQEELDNLLKAFPSLSTVRLDVSKDKEALQKLIRESNIVISLLPQFLHHAIALICIDEKKNLITTSYLDYAMRSLHESAVAAGITVLNEAGLDPGLDHMIAMKSVDALKQVNGQISELRSLCGGIPAEEWNAGPIKYKFSWYPKGVFLSALQPSRCLLDEKIVDYETIYEHAETFTGHFEDYKLECLPNRDALIYRDMYDIPTASVLFRGTLRHLGFSKVLKALATIGLMEQSALPELESNAPILTWKELIIILLKLPHGRNQETVEKAVLEKLSNDQEQLKILTDLELISNKTVPKKSTPLDSLCAHLVHFLAYEPGEQDLVLMLVKVSAQLASGQQCIHETTLIEKGTPIGGHSAMSRIVGLTAAACADLLASGAVQGRGVILPITKDIYEPVLAKLLAEGIKIETTVSEV